MTIHFNSSYSFAQYSSTIIFPPYFIQSIIDLQYYVSFRCTKTRFNTFIHYEVITILRLVTMCNHTSYYQYNIIDYISYAICCSPTSSVHFSHLVIYNSVATWTAACLASIPITNSWSLLKLMSIEWVMLSNHLILCHPLLPPSV